jgi:hypothetical protein
VAEDGHIGPMGLIRPIRLHGDISSLWSTGTVGADLNRATVSFDARAKEEINNIADVLFVG